MSPASSDSRRSPRGIHASSGAAVGDDVGLGDGAGVGDDEGDDVTVQSVFALDASLPAAFVVPASHLTHALLLTW